MAFLPEPPHQHGTLSKIGVLLINLGTPDAPDTKSVRRYLAEFLADRRVVEIPRAAWWLILHGIILRTRPKQSAAKYASIWAQAGSPLLVESKRQVQLLKGYLGEALRAQKIPAEVVPIALGMRYGNPSIPSAINELKAAGCERLLVLPLYPQYAASATGTAFDAVTTHLRRVRRVPGVRLVDAFHDDPGYLKALKMRVNEYWEKNGRPDRLVISFHGVPRFTLDKGDPYHCHCLKTARLLATELGLAEDKYIVAFQSRFGRTEWIKPYLMPTLAELGRSGVGRVDVFCPGFVADCLETLEEVAVEGKAEFLAAGGKEFHHIPCLNDHPAWITAMRDLILTHLGGWLHLPPPKHEREKQAVRAQRLGAKT